MKWAWNHKKWIGYGVIALLLILLISQMNITWRDTNAPILAQNPNTVTGKELEGLPNEKDFVQVAENDTLRLKFDELTGHFIVEDKRNSNVWRSYPDPEQWDNVGIGGGWLTNLQSTVMFQHIDFSNPKANPRESNAIKELTKVTDVHVLDHGVEFKLEIQKSQFIIPVRITIQDDYVETTIIDDGIEELGINSLLWLRLYPFFSAVQNDENGYLFIPDGSGALISFQEQRSSIKQLYQERVYGADTSFISSPSSRNSILMPVYGMKSGDKAFIAVIHEGAEYSDVVASPSSVFSNYNWIGSQQAYRMRYRQVTNAEANRSFETYTKDARFDGDRVTRYYLLDTDQADYVGMASTYRRYLMEEYELDKITLKNGEVPLYLSLLGADRERGLITDRYVKATTTSEAMQIVQELYGLGVENMVVNYAGWQKDGYSSLGGYLDVDKRIGGNQGMRHFIDYAGSLDIPVYLDVNYSINTTAATGFRPRHHGVRDLSGTLMSYTHYSGDQMTLSSRKFIVDSLSNDLASYQKLGVAGLTMSGLGHNVSTDYNTKFGGTRTETIRYDQEALRMVKENVGSTHAVNPGFYTLGQINHIHQLVDDYSYDLFSSRAVPFAQIVLHGLITYTSAPENDRSEFRRDFLRDIEYGAYPSFDFTMAGSEELIGVYWYTPKNSSFNDWKVDVVEQYQRYNEALKDVQDQFIVGHRELASGVMETEYENGKKVVVNYNRKEYSIGQVKVPAMDYIVIEGGRNNEAVQKIESIFIGQIGRLTVSFSLVGWIFAFMVFPLGFSFYMSFNNVRITPQGLDIQYKGLTYYKSILFQNGSVLYDHLIPFLRQALIMIPIIVIFALLVAIMLNYRFPGRAVFRTIFFLPVIFSTGEIIQEFYSQGDGALGFLEQYDLSSYISMVLPNSWAGTLTKVLDSFVLILWYSGVQILIFLAGRQTISASVYEAARIDGASPWESFWKITLPAMIPFIFLNLIYTVVDLFTYPWNPIIERVKSNSDYGLSSALIWIYFAIILLFLAVVFLVFHRVTRNHQQTN